MVDVWASYKAFLPSGVHPIVTSSPWEANLTGEKLSLETGFEFSPCVGGHGRSSACALGNLNTGASSWGGEAGDPVRADQLIFWKI